MIFGWGAALSIVIAREGGDPMTTSD